MDIKGECVNVVMYDDAHGIPGSVWENPDGSYTIFIDASLDEDSQQKVFYHELSHIFHEDFSKKDIQDIESVAHKRGRKDGNSITDIINN